MNFVIEKRVVFQEWYETELTKTGWDSHGWRFDDGFTADGWEISDVIEADKHYNPIIAIAERKFIITK